MKPNLKRNNNTLCILDCFLTLLSAASNEECMWQWGKTYNDILPKNYMKKFARTLHPKNLLTSFHPAVTNVHKQCRCHHDSNLNSKSLEEAICISVIKKLISVNGQQRKSIDNYYNRVHERSDVFVLLVMFCRIYHLPELMFITSCLGER